MKTQIRKIRLNELHDFVSSEIFLALRTKPISLSRAKSYLANPHSKPEDTVLYLLFIDSELIAFRSIFADVFQNESSTIRFGWCSGSWVHPSHRRKGFSETLLKEAYEDWNQKLMFTNYAPNSEKLNLKTGWFKSIHQFEGVRGYLFPKTRKLIHASNRNFITKFGFSILDLFIALLSHIRILFYQTKKFNQLDFIILEQPDEECYAFQKSNPQNNVLQRGNSELQWIFNFPWIADENREFAAQYPFSSCVEDFRYQVVKIYCEGKCIGFFIFSVREGHLKSLHFNITKNIWSEIADFLTNYAVKKQIGVISLNKKALTVKMFQRKFPFLHLRKHGQRIYSTFGVPVGNDSFQDGDGDVFFT